MAEYKKETLLGIVIAIIVGLSVVVGVLYLPPKSPSSATQISTGACAKSFPPLSAFFPNPNDMETTFANGTVLNKAWMYALIMPESSSGQLCVFYHGFENRTMTGPIQPTIEYFATNDTIRPTSFVTISPYPTNFSLSSGGNQSIAFTFKAPQNSRGIYYFNIPGQCSTPPLVVGYSLSQLNASDFLPWTNARSCPTGFATVSYLGLTNIQVGFIPYYSRS